MKRWQKIAIGSTLLVLDLQYWYLRRLHFQAVAAQTHPILSHTMVEAKLDRDDQVVLKQEHPESLQDERNLSGRILWVSAGGQLDFFRVTGRSVDSSRSAGVLLGAERIAVRDAWEQRAPAGMASRLPLGDAQVFLIFTRPDAGREANTEYAVAVGDREGETYNLLTDQLLFYEDPHRSFAYWGADVWKAIDAHVAIRGMNVRQVRMALGQSNTPRGDIMGDRAVEFENQGKPKFVTFENGKVTTILDETDSGSRQRQMSNYGRDK